MHSHYPGVITRFLRNDERLVLSKINDMPLVIEADKKKDIKFLQTFLKTHSAQILADVAKYGAVLFRGFNINSDTAFEKTLLSIKGLHGISEAFMSEEGRIHASKLKYVLQTNAVYKTGGTLYLGGFHGENYYSTDVPAYISFCCLKPSLRGGETGLINMEKIYPQLNTSLKKKLEKKPYFVCKWLISEVADRYHLSAEKVEKIAQQYDLPILGENDEKFILMYKPSVFKHPITKKKALQINLFEILTLNEELRQCFLKDYQGKDWFWHRVVWRLPSFILKTLEFFYIIFASFFYSPKDSLKILRNKLFNYKASFNEHKLAAANKKKVGACFNSKEIKTLAQLMRDNYTSCLWKKGDIILVDNRKVMHAGMPGCGPRLVRALICNPLDMTYNQTQSGTFDCKERRNTVASALAHDAQIPNRNR